MTRAESPMYVEIAGSVVRTVMRVCRSLVLPRCEEVFYGKTLAEALAWCLVWLMAPEMRGGPFLV
jgi:hypothetical protein